MNEVTLVLVSMAQSSAEIYYLLIVAYKIGSYVSKSQQTGLWWEINSLRPSLIIIKKLKEGLHMLN